MNAKLTGLIIVIVIALGGGAYVITQSDSDDTNSNNTSTTQSVNETADGDQPEFQPAATFEESFVATISGSSDGDSFAATLEFDGNGNGKFSSQQDGLTSDIYFTADSFIICQEGECFKTPGTGSELFDLDQYGYSTEDFNEFRELANYEGRRDCPAGTCDVWHVTDEGLDTRIFIEAGSQRISQVIGVEDEETTTIVYEFKDVTITLPENIQELPGQ